MASKPVLILEGAGDIKAVPFILRELSGYQINPASHPISKQTIERLSKHGELERFAKYGASREDADSVLFLLDVDEKCARDVVEEWVPRLHAMKLDKKIGIGLFVREFESFFLACLDNISEKYKTHGWSLDNWDVNDDHEAPRGAKEKLSGYMKKGKSYKETRDQAKFVSVLDFDRLRERCRSFRHLESLVAWLQDDNASSVYPTI